MIRPPPRSTLFPSPTLFRSGGPGGPRRGRGGDPPPAGRPGAAAPPGRRGPPRGRDLLQLGPRRARLDRYRPGIPPCGRRPLVRVPRQRRVGALMVIVRLMGGLGNQMFQYAAARRIALAHRVPLKLDISWFAHWPARAYAVHGLDIQATFATPDELRQDRKSVV